jgi:hypothetical protein
VTREAVRAILLCEDQRHQSFAERLLRKLGIQPFRVFVHPGRASAEQWVREQYSSQVKAHRSQANHQKNLMLLVLTDGDRLGVTARKESLDKQLVGQGKPSRGPSERILCFVPTWSIETWLIWLCGAETEFVPFGETTKLKGGTFDRLFDGEKISMKLAAENWTTARPDETKRLPSLADAREELRRAP